MPAVPAPPARTSAAPRASAPSQSAPLPARASPLAGLSGWWAGVTGREARPSVAAAAAAAGAGATLADARRAPVDAAPAATPQKKHLVVLVHGLVGSEANWTVALRSLERVAPADWHVLPSISNRFARTFDGVDACGDRLAAEVRAAVKQGGGPGAYDRVSFVGHRCVERSTGGGVWVARGCCPAASPAHAHAHPPLSMGGLVARHAVGRLFDPSTRTLAGVRAAHFVSLATPHLGCAHEPGHPAEVPLIAWLRGSAATRGATDALAGRVSGRVAARLGRTGAHFFMSDDPTNPLLLRMTRDGPGEGEAWASGLQAFATRTTYANSGGDHLVGWANASLRHPRDLPDLSDAPAGRGVVRDDGRAAAFGGAADARASAPRRPPSAAAAAADAAHASSPHADAMLAALTASPWRRVDACFKGTHTRFFSHNLIQATRHWLNFEGEDHVDALVRELVAVDGELVERWREEKRGKGGRGK